MSRGDANPPVLAQGEYEYLCDGQLMPITERWHLVRSAGLFEIYSERTVPSQSLRVRVLARIESGRIGRCALSWGVDGEMNCRANATYRVGADGRGAVYRYRRPGFPARGIPMVRQHFFPLLRIFSGQLLGALASAGGSGEVLVPWIHDPAQGERLFAPEFSTRTVGYQGPGRAAKPGNVSDCFLYAGGQYGQGAEYDVADGLLQEYRWWQGEKQWRVRLREFSGQWPGAELWPHARCAAVAAGSVGV
ncbi:hypothetical protein ACNKU7_17615 [Microbulbifer sp. SA54]|uniref:hypothetical protein n=1 Tax=Microbulbifer sp. SA54 TaxID=3401577 RepID=UPI003AAFEE2B